MKTLIRRTAITATAAFFFQFPAAAIGHSVQPVTGRTPQPVTFGVAETVNGWPVMPGSPECTPLWRARYIPTEARLVEIRYRVRQGLLWDIDHGVLTTTVDLAAARQMLNYMPWPRWFDRPLYGTWSLVGVPFTGCAQSVALPTGTLISVDDPTRVEAIVVWEWVNWYLTTIGRSDLWDTSYVTKITSAVGAQVGGWRKE